MKQFKDFGITPSLKPMVGDKIKIDKIINVPIIVMDYRITDSNFKDKGNGKYLCLQIEYKGEKHVVFTGSTVLQELIEQVPKSEFPFTTTIIAENDAFIFS